jgi:protein phosphatase
MSETEQDEVTRRMRYGQATHIGQMRENNQDAAWSFASRGDSAEGEADFGMFVVADGMGGHEHGERASAIAVRKVTSEVIQKVFAPMMTGEGEMSPAFEALLDGVGKANSAIVRAVPDGGTTLTAALIMGDMLHIAHVGDSRAYLVSGGDTFEQLTEDHSMEKRLADLDALDPDEDFAMKNMLYRSLGLREDVEADTIRRRLPASMTLLVCSDGLWNLVEDSEIAAHMREDTDPQTICDRLVSLANQRGGHDNITVVIARTG